MCNWLSRCRDVTLNSFGVSSIILALFFKVSVYQKYQEIPKMLPHKLFNIRKKD